MHLPLPDLNTHHFHQHVSVARLYGLISQIKETQPCLLFLL